MSRSANRKLSIWRPIASAKAIMVEESNVLKAHHVDRSVIISQIDKRVGGERVDRFYRKAISSVAVDSGVPWQKLMAISIGFLLLTVAFIHYDLINLKIIQLCEHLPTWDNIQSSFRKLTLSNFMQTMGELGLKVSRLDR